MELPLNYQDIIKMLPHRYPFLLVDRITELEPWKRIVGIKNVTINEQFFQGHFPGNPVMPGVLIIEAMAQVGGVLARVSVSEGKDVNEAPTVYFMSIDNVKFRKPVVPGDQLKFELIPIRTGSRVWKLAGKAFVEGSLAAEAEFMAQITQ
jgi:3-hydroxyacyl-[acyl-carrier-protein] dehydratase